MPFSIRPVDITKVPEIAKVMVNSRWTDPHWKVLFEKNTTAEQVIFETGQRLPWNLINQRATKRHQMAVDHLTGEVVGYARWILPDCLSCSMVVWEEAQVEMASEEEHAGYQEAFGHVTDEGRIRHLRMDLMEYRSTPLEEVDAKIQERGPFLTLDYLSTAPHYQRRGVGSALLRHGLDVADSNGLSTYVTASPAGLKLYLNHGFEVVETVAVDYSAFGGTEPVRDFFMIRKPLRQA